MQITDRWLRDLPQQFQAKHNIEVLIRAFSRQLEEVERAFLDINDRTDIDTACGTVLDHVGTIVRLSRKEAYGLAGGAVEGELLPDDRYRIYMRYKILRDTSDCTYYDIMEAIDLLWDVQKASYYEREERPATIFIGLPDVDVDSDDPAKGKPGVLRPGGVGFIYTVRYWIEVCHRRLERMYLKDLTMRMRAPFWGCAIYDGSWRYDGSIRMDARQRYDLVLRLRYMEGAIISGEDFRSPVLVIRSASSVNEDADAPRMVIRSCIGSLDVLCRHPVRAAVEVRSVVGSCTEDLDGSVCIKRDPGYYDGLCRYDGARYYNAIYRKEAL